MIIPASIDLKVILLVLSTAVDWEIKKPPFFFGGSFYNEAKLYLRE